jgi:peptide/nickel transport system permease protein
MFAFPGILLALGIGAALGAGLQSMVIAMVVVTIPEFGRLVRGTVLGVKEEPFVEAAVTLGIGPLRTAALHVAPNVMSPLIVMGALQTGKNVILAASLSFLGLGAEPPTDCNDQCPSCRHPGRFGHRNSHNRIQSRR